MKDDETEHELKDKARAEIKRMAKRRRGKITPQQVLDAARDEDSPLHPFFEWDDDEAAEKWRLMQARTLIKSVKVEIQTTTTKIKAVAFVRDPSKDSDDSGYVSVKSVKSDKDAQREILITEFDRARSALKRARKLAMVFDLLDEMDTFIDQLDQMKTNVMDEPSMRQ